MSSLHSPVSSQAMHTNLLCACWHLEAMKGSSSLTSCRLLILSRFPPPLSGPNWRSLSPPRGSDPPFPNMASPFTGSAHTPLPGSGTVSLHIKIPLSLWINAKELDFKFSVNFKCEKNTPRNIDIEVNIFFLCKLAVQIDKVTRIFIQYQKRDISIFMVKNTYCVRCNLTVYIENGKIFLYNLWNNYFEVMDLISSNISATVTPNSKIFHYINQKLPGCDYFKCKSTGLNLLRRSI
jgi:hypothetical protein